MTSRPAGNASTGGAQVERSYFEEQRELLTRDLAVGLEDVLQNLNKLNRSLEGITAVGNEFSSVEALWSHFENLMAKEVPEEQAAAAAVNAQPKEGDEATSR